MKALPFKIFDGHVNDSISCLDVDWNQKSEDDDGIHKRQCKDYTIFLSCIFLYTSTSLFALHYIFTYNLFVVVWYTKDPR